jgi:hypothetical protein
MSELGGKYAVTKDGDLDGENIEAVVVYGNHIKANPSPRRNLKTPGLSCPIRRTAASSATFPCPAWILWHLPRLLTSTGRPPNIW